MWLGEQTMTEHRQRCPPADLPRYRRKDSERTQKHRTSYQDGGISIVTLIIFVLLAVLVTAGVVLIQEGQRRIPVQYAKRVVGRKMYGGQSTHIPIKVNQAGVIPIIFALSLLQFPLTITYFLKQGNAFSVWVTKWLSPSGDPGVWIYGVLNIVLIIFFTYFYTGITFNPNEVANNMKANGGFIPGIRPGKATEDYLNKVMSRVTIVGAIFLALIATLPTIISVMVPGAQGYPLRRHLPADRSRCCTGFCQTA